jgi:peptide/nickel transport system permease protein
LTADASPAPVADRPSRPRRRSTARKLLRDPQAVIAATVLLLVVVSGVLAPLLASHDPNAASLGHIDADAGTPGYPLGGDRSGRDIWARLLHSINTSVVSALIGAGVALVIGVTAGLVGGYHQRIRGGAEWVFGLVMTFPGLLLLIVLMPLTGGDFRVTMAIFGVLLSPGVYRLVRNQVVGVRNELFVDAARVSGLTDRRILARHVLFAVRRPVIVATAFLCGQAVGVQAGLAFLGVGPATTPSFGSMISEGFHNLYVAPLQFVWPSLVLGAMTASLVLFGNALRDALEGAARRPARITPSRSSGRRGAGDEAGPAGLLVVEDLTIAYPTPSGGLREVVSGVGLTVEAGETLGLVGESGSGKTQTAFAALGVLPAEAAVSRGSIRLDGRELLGTGERAIADEPTTALDVTVQAEILDLLRDLQKELNMGVLLVTHDFGVVADVCDRIAVMREGEIVETGTALEIFREAHHPYTRMLLGSVPDEHTVRTDPPVAVADDPAKEDR